MTTSVSQTVTSLVHMKSKIAGIKIGYTKAVVKTSYRWVTTALAWHRKVVDPCDLSDSTLGYRKGRNTHRPS